MGRDQAWLFKAIGIVVVVAVCATAMRVWTGYPGNPKGETSLTIALVVVALAALGRFLSYLWQLWSAGCDRPIATMRASFPCALREFIPIAAGVGVIGIFLFSLSYLKSMITAIVPFWADAAFAASDRMLFVNAEGVAIALGPLLPVLGLFYGLWHAAHLGGILWVLHWREGEKARFILGFMLTWSIGMLFAYIFSSAGPIFTGQFDPAVAPESVQRPAAILWANYQAQGAVIGGGISAFPSMHVAIAAWLALVLKARGWPKLGLTYLIGVFGCSVILGWHYVVDGVAGIVIALFADRLAKAWLTQRQAQMPITGRPAAAPN